MNQRKQSSSAVRQTKAEMEQELQQLRSVIQAQESTIRNQRQDLEQAEWLYKTWQNTADTWKACSEMKEKLFEAQLRERVSAIRREIREQAGDDAVRPVPLYRKADGSWATAFALN